MVSGFTGFNTKPKSTMNREELNAAVDKKQALPDLVLKRVYFNAQENMKESETQLMYNYYRNGGIHNELDVFRLRSNILGLFRLISGMILENGYMTWKSSEYIRIHKNNGVNTDFELCLKLSRYAQLDVPTLIHLAGYLHQSLHELGLTNLLINDLNKEVDIEDLI
jgi:hypothetical protein